MQTCALSHTVETADKMSSQECIISSSMCVRCAISYNDESVSMFTSPNDSFSQLPYQRTGSPRIQRDSRGRRRWLYCTE
jgi:hypothetical protein